MLPANRRLLVMLAVTVALSGCGTPPGPTQPTGTMAITAAPAPIAMTTWRCMARTPFVSADCASSFGAGRSLATAVAAASAPGAPSTLAAIVTGSTVQLAWTAPAGGDAAASYIVEAGSSSGLANLASFDTGSTAAALTVDAVPAGTYFVRVRARNAAGVSGASNEIVLTVSGGPSACTAAPGAPTDLSAAVTDLSVRLTWTAPAGGCAATSYILEAGSGPGLSNLASLDTGTTTTAFSAGDVAPGTYFVRIRAVNANGSSAPSNEVRLTTSVSCTAPASPSSLEVSVTGTTMSLTWGGASGGPTSYIVELGTATGLSDIAVTNTGNTSTSLSATLAPGTYFARVRATNACATSAASNEVTFTIQAACTIPPSPANLVATASGTSVSLAWDGASGATSYVIDVGSSSGASDVAASIDTGSTATALTTTLAAGTYFIRVRAKNGCGQSGSSNEVTVTVQNQTPTPTPAIITITSSGVSPKQLIVSPGTRVLFINNDSRVHEMTSDPHPEHDDCPEINQVGFLVEGQRKETGNLNTVRSCGYHDHLNFSNTAVQGTILIR